MFKHILQLLFIVLLPAISNGQCISCSSTTPINIGLIGCFPFNGNANDNISSANNGTATNVTNSTNRFSTPTSSYSTNGTSTSKVTIPSTNYLLNSFSYSIWVKFTSLPASGNGMSIICNGTPATANQSIVLVNSGGTYTWNGISYYNNTSADNAVSGSASVNTSTWYFIVFTRDSLSQTSKLYVNNTLVATNSSLTNAIAAYGASSQFIVGTRGTAQYFNGQVDDLRIHNRALSASEISSLYSTTSESVPTDAGTANTICSGDSIQLSASGANSYTWTPATTLSSSTAYNPYARPSSTTKYYVTGTIGSCTSTDSVTITVNTNCCNTCNNPVPLNYGLVACYPLDGNANCMVSSANNGTMTSTTNAVNRFGRSNASMLFNGTSSKIAIPGVNFQFNDYSYSVWVNISVNPSSGNAQAILSIGNGGTLGDQDILVANNYSTPSQTGFDAVSYTNPANFPSPPDRAVSGSLPTTGTWYHIVSTRNSSTGKIKVYVNGVMMNEFPLTTTTAGYATPILGHIGVRSHAIGQFFNGVIDDVRIYNRAISDLEVVELYNLADVGTTLTVNAGADKLICAGDSVQLNPTSTGATTFSWSPSIGLSNSSIASPIAKPSSTQQYIVIVSNGTCQAKDTVTVEVSTTCCTDCTTPVTLNNGLIACFPFNGNANDESGNGNNGTAQANATLTTDRNNVASKAYSFNGSSTSRINVPASTTLNTATMSGFTYACWVNPATFNTNPLYRRIFCIQDASLQNYDLSFNYANNKLNFINYDGVNNNINFDSKSTIPSNSWTHIVVVIDVSNQPKLYINGVLDTFSTTSVIKPTNPTYTIGNHAVNSWNFAGKIDDIRVYNRAISAREIAELYILNPTISTQLVVSNDTTICSGDSARLTASGASNLKWRFNLSLSDSTNANPYAKPNTKTKYYVTGTSGSCSVTDSVEVDVTIVNADAGIDKSICNVDSVQLLATGGTSYRWSYNTTLSDTTIANPYAKPTSTTKYYVTVTDGVCKAKDSVTISIANSVNVDAGIDKQVCEGDSVQLQATGANNYTWLPISGLSNPTISNPKAAPTILTDYIVQGQISGCIGYDTVRVSILPKPVVNIGPDIDKCINDDYTFNPTVSNADQYLWNPATKVSNASILTPTTNTKTNQTFTLKVRNSVTGCENTDTILVNVRVPKASFTLSDTLGVRPPFTVTAINTSTPSNLASLWIVGDSIPANYTSTNMTHNFVTVGRFPITLRVTDNIGCMDSVTQFVTVGQELPVFIPNVFTPNGDGTNDYFVITYDELNSIILKGSIWNRWGGKIYEFNMPGDKWWDGTYEGVPVAADVYFYIIEIMSKQGKTQKFHGTVTLLK